MPQTYGPPLRFETPDFVFRSLVHGDETEEWGGWLADPKLAVMLNARPRVRSIAELTQYIDSFDRIDRHLFGIFERRKNRLIGIRTAELHRSRRTFGIHMLVGGRGDWGGGSMDQTTAVLNNWAYEVQGMEWSEAQVLAHNKKMIRYLCDNGWTIVGKGMVPAADTLKLIDIIQLRRHRDVWRKDHRSSAVTGISPATGLETAS